MLVLILLTYEPVAAECLQERWPRELVFTNMHPLANMAVVYMEGEEKVFSVHYLEAIDITPSHIKAKK